MKIFTSVTGPAAPLMLANIDTDIIIRIERLTKSRDSDELARYAMEALRYLPDGNDDPAFICNQPAFRNAPILIAGANFGCGSSREGAVWALMGMGFRCVIAPSFGDIFYSNCFQNGMLALALPEAEIETLAAEAAGGANFTVDLQRKILLHPDGRATEFAIDAQRRETLLAGMDEIDLTLLEEAGIREWQERDRTARPWVWEISQPQENRIHLIS
jgi:3-isopropylmalate/(R)-2-methylmalate dehydratase small subunit